MSLTPTRDEKRSLITVITLDISYTPIKYDGVDDFKEGLARVGLNNKHGFINKAGKEVIPLQYDGAGVFKKGLAKVKLNGEIFQINKKGKRTD